MSNNVEVASFGERSLLQQGYDHSPSELRQLEWGLRFTPLLCMAGAIVGLVLGIPAIHFALAALGIVPFWFPAWHPLDRFYNHVLRPLWGGVPLPPNPLPRRIACFMGGAVNVAIGVSFAVDAYAAAYAFGVLLISLQLIVITTHFCVASWLYEGVLRLTGRWQPPIEIAQARSIVDQGGQLVDVRTPEEFAEGHLPGALNRPVDSISEHPEEFAGSTLVLYCRSGMRSRVAAQHLNGTGVESVHDMGAMARWGDPS